jgi:hypothetical protein
MAYTFAASTISIRTDEEEFFLPALLYQEEDGGVSYWVLDSDACVVETFALEAAKAALRTVMIEAVGAMKKLGFDEINGVRDRGSR